MIIETKLKLLFSQIVVRFYSLIDKNYFLYVFCKERETGRMWFQTNQTQL